MNRPLIIAAVVLGVVSTGITYWLLSRAAGSPEQRLVKVVRAKRELPLGTVLRSEDLEVGPVRMATATRDALRSPADAIGRATTQDPPAGTVLTRAHVAPAPAAPSYTVEGGMRAFIIAVEAQVGAARLVRPGDRIDILYMGVDSKAAQVLAQNIRVIELPDAKIAGKGEGKATATPEGKANLVVEVTPDEAACLFAAHTTGVLSVALRNRSDTVPVLVEPVLAPPAAASEEPQAPPERPRDAEPRSSQPNREPGPRDVAPPLPVPRPAPVESVSSPMTPGKRVTVIRGTDRQVVDVEE